MSTRGEIRLVQYTNQTDSASAELVSQKLVSYPPARMFCGPLPNSPQVWWGPGKFALLRIAEYGDFAAARARIRGDHDGGRLSGSVLSGQGGSGLTWQGIKKPHTR